jgi:hypothetical protein
MNGEIKSLVTIALANKMEQFKGAMKDSGIDESTASNILQSVTACEDLVTSTFDLFKSAKCIEKYMTTSKNYVAPIRLPLGDGNFHYVPVIDILKRVTADPTFKKVRVLPKYRSKEEDESLQFCLSDVDDGQRLRSIQFFQSNPDALR